MNSLLLFNLLLGTLMVVPDLSKGQMVLLSVPIFSAIGKELRMRCSYSNANLKTVELEASKKVRLVYNSTNPLNPNITLDVVETMPGLSFEMEEGSTKNKGAVIFYIKKLNCEDFKSYTCMVNKKRSQSKTLKLDPGVDSITTNPMELIVNKTFTFTCKGTSPKGKSYEVLWYRNRLINANKLSSPKPQIKGDLKCSNAVESQLVYTVKESDAPKLTLWCGIKTNFIVPKSMTFNVTALTKTTRLVTTPKPTTQPNTRPKPTTQQDTAQTPNSKPDCKSEPQPDCRQVPHFPNSAPSNMTKTLVTALNYILIFLVLFS